MYNKGLANKENPVVAFQPFDMILEKKYKKD
jgi:hypothetical protein